MKTIIDPTVLAAIGLAALVTYILRAGGLLLAERLPDSGKFKRFMDALPGTILVALVAPGIAAAGLWGIAAAAGVAVCVRKTGNLFLAMLVGMAVIIVQRQLAG